MPRDTFEKHSGAVGWRGRRHRRRRRRRRAAARAASPGRRPCAQGSSPALSVAGAGMAVAGARSRRAKSQRSGIQAARLRRAGGRAGDFARARLAGALPWRSTRRAAPAPLGDSDSGASGGPARGLPGCRDWQVPAEPFRSSGEGISPFLSSSAAGGPTRSLVAGAASGARTGHSPSSSFFPAVRLADADPRRVDARALAGRHGGDPARPSLLGTASPPPAVERRVGGRVPDAAHLRLGGIVAGRAREGLGPPRGAGASGCVALGPARLAVVGPAVDRADPACQSRRSQTRRR